MGQHNSDFLMNEEWYHRVQGTLSKAKTGNCSTNLVLMHHYWGENKRVISWVNSTIHDSMNKHTGRDTWGAGRPPNK